jgi:O-antigen ligase
VAAGVLGKDETLTGRVYLWKAVLSECARHPFFGIGYGGFWEVEGAPSADVLGKFKWASLQAHNGYIDVLNEMGVVGLMLLAIFVICAFRRTLRCHDGALFLIVTASVVANFAETTFCRLSSLGWLAVIFCYVASSHSTAGTVRSIGRGNSLENPRLGPSVGARQDHVRRD